VPPRPARRLPPSAGDVGISRPSQAYSPQLTELIASGAVLPPATPGGTDALLALPVPTGEARYSTADLEALAVSTFLADDKRLLDAARTAGLGVAGPA
jgi:hypothetical protein